MTSLLGFLLLFNITLIFAANIYLIDFRRDLTFPEGAVVYGARQAALGLPVYEDWRQWPHRFAPYGPALYYPVGWVARLAGVCNFDFLIYQLGRWQSMLSLFGIAIAAGLLARRAGVPRCTAFICGFGLMSLWPRMLSYCVSYRPDAPMVLCNLLAVWLALGGLEKRWRCWLTLGLLWLAAGFKPQGWAAPLAVAFFALQTLGLRRARQWGGIYLGGGLIAVLSMNFLTHGRFTLNTVNSLINDLSVPSVLFTMSQDWVFNADHLLRFLLLPALGLWLSLRKLEPPAVRALGLYCLLSPIVTAFQLCKIGSDLNYLLEPFMLAATACALVYARWLAPGIQASLRLKIPLWLLAVMIIAWPLGNSITDTARSLKIISQSATRYRAAQPLMDQPPPMLLLDSAFTHYTEQVHAIPDPLQYCILVNRGKLSPDTLLRRLNERSYRMVALSPVAHSAFFEQCRDRRIPASLERNYELYPGTVNPEVWLLRP